MTNKLRIQRLESREDLRDLVYNIKGILESQERLGGLLERLNSTLGRNREESQRVASQIEVEVYADLQHHLEELKQPLLLLLKEVYGSVERPILYETKPPADS